MNKGDIINIGRVLVTVGSQNAPNIKNGPGTTVGVQSGQPQEGSVGTVIVYKANGDVVTASGSK